MTEMGDRYVKYMDLNDREILMLMADRVERLDHSVNGNGRQGLVERMAAVEQEVDDVKEAAPSAKERWGLLGTVAVAAAGVLAKVLGVPLPL